MKTQQERSCLTLVVEFGLWQVTRTHPVLASSAEPKTHLLGFQCFQCRVVSVLPSPPKQNRRTVRTRAVLIGPVLILRNTDARTGSPHHRTHIRRPPHWAASAQQVPECALECPPHHAPPCGSDLPVSQACVVACVVASPACGGGACDMAQTKEGGTSLAGVV